MKGSECRTGNEDAALIKQSTPEKIYSLHGPEVECISKGKAKAAYELAAR